MTSFCIFIAPSSSTTEPIHNDYSPGYTTEPIHNDYSPSYTTEPIHNDYSSSSTTEPIHPEPERMYVIKHYVFTVISLKLFMVARQCKLSFL